MKLFYALTSQLLLIALARGSPSPRLNLKDPEEPIVDLKDPIDPSLDDDAPAEVASSSAAGAAAGGGGASAASAKAATAAARPAAARPAAPRPAAPRPAAASGAAAGASAGASRAAAASAAAAGRSAGASSAAGSAASSAGTADAAAAGSAASGAGSAEAAAAAAAGASGGGAGADAAAAAAAASDAGSADAAALAAAGASGATSSSAAEAGAADAAALAAAGSSDSSTAAGASTAGSSATGASSAAGAASAAGASASGLSASKAGASAAAKTSNATGLFGNLGSLSSIGSAAAGAASATGGALEGFINQGSATTPEMMSAIGQAPIFLAPPLMKTTTPAISSAAAASGRPPLAAAAGAMAAATATATAVPMCTTMLPAAINDFSFTLFKELMLKDKKNIFFSPLAVATGLAIAYHGSGGNTAKQIETALELPKYLLTDKNITEEFPVILSDITQDNDNYMLIMATDMFLQDNIDVQSKFSSDLSEFFQSSVQNLDFTKDGQSAINDINVFVADKSNMKIPKLFHMPITPSPVMAIVSVCYFKGNWKTPFPKELTKNQEFKKLSGISKTVSMMTLKKKTFRYMEDVVNSYKYLELPFTTGDVVMLLALPNNRTSPDLAITAEFLCSLNGSMADILLEEVKIPKFKIEFSSRMHQVLPALGIIELFQKGKANLTAISSGNRLFLNPFVHKAILEVDEEGPSGSSGSAEASASASASASSSASSASASASAAAGGPTFIADHPFILYIVDKRKGIIVFGGKLVDPES